METQPGLRRTDWWDVLANRAAAALAQERIDGPTFRAAGELIRRVERAGLPPPVGFALPASFVLAWTGQGKSLFLSMRRGGLEIEVLDDASGAAVHRESYSERPAGPRWIPLPKEPAAEAPRRCSLPRLFGAGGRK